VDMDTIQPDHSRSVNDAELESEDETRQALGPSTNTKQPSQASSAADVEDTVIYLKMRSPLHPAMLLF
jgi:hypothetical protein